MSDNIERARDGLTTAERQDLAKFTLRSCAKVAKTLKQKGMPRMTDITTTGRKVELPLNDLLDLVGCAADYGYDSDILYSALAKWSGWVTDEEICTYTDWFVTPEARKQGYGEEDRDKQRERLTEWRDRYCKPKRNVPRLLSTQF